MPKHYVTFGQVHVHSVNGKTFDKDCVAVYDAESNQHGRAKAFEYFGDKFFTDYTQEQWSKELAKSDIMSFFPRGYIDVDKATPDLPIYTRKQMVAKIREFHDDFCSGTGTDAERDHWIASKI